MQLTKFGHACIRVTAGDATIVVDPGAYTQDDALDGADAVLVTHEHADHFVEDKLRAALDAQPALQIWTNAAVADLMGGAGQRVHVVGDGDAFSVGGIDVTVHGEWHEQVHPDMPRAKNVGFLMAGRVFHPGDAWTLPGTRVAALMLPVHAPWSKLAEVIDYVRAVAPGHAYAAHDMMLSEIGLSLVDRVLGPQGIGVGSEFTRLAVGATVDV